MQNPKFVLKECLKTAENLLCKDTKNQLEYWQENLLKYYFWYKIPEKQIKQHLSPKKYHYKIGNLLRHKASDFRGELSEALREPITKSSIIEPLRRQWQRDIQANLTLKDRFINFLVYADESINFIDLEIEVLRGSLEGKTYTEIAENLKRSCTGKVCKSIWECQCKYTEDYIRRDVGSKLWKKMSAIMGEKIDKKNCIEVFETWQKVVK
ncbi:MAG: hypothetical protein ACRC1Z_09775 [Waterburya sp.]